VFSVSAFPPSTVKAFANTMPSKSAFPAKVDEPTLTRPILKASAPIVEEITASFPAPPAPSAINI